MTKSIATRCPICSADLFIGRLCCSSCDTRIDTAIAFDPLMRLSEDQRQFVLVFLRCRGNIRDVERELEISYPTVCKRLDGVNEAIAAGGKKTGSGPATEPANRRTGNRLDILARVERGEISAKQAADLLKGK